MLEFFVRSTSNGQAQAIVSEDLKFFDVFHRFSRIYGMDAARIVSDHSSQCAMTVGGRIRAKREVKAFGCSAKIIQHNAGFNTGDSLFGYDVQNPVDILG